MLEVEKLDLFYGDAQALDGVSLSAAEGELVAIVGANGAGKSSLIRTIAGIETPRAGRIRFRGADITGHPSHRVCNLGVGQVAEGRQIFPTLTVEENLEMGALVPRARGRMQETLGEVFALFPRLAERRRQVAGTLSGGEQQMLAIGRCLMGRPDLIMLDEPSLGLAPTLVQELFGTIRALNERGLTILLVEQNVAHSLKLADRGYVLENGRIVLSGAGRALLSDEGVRQAYLGMRPEQASAKPAKPAFKPIEFAPPLVERRDLPGGVFELFSPVPLRPYATSLAHLLRRQAEAHPDRDFLAERDASGAWRRLTYAAASRQANAVAQALLDRGCSPERPLMILSGNGIDHAALTFGAYVAGVPAVPVSVAYSLMSQDHDKLRHIFALIRPRVVYAASGKAFSKALAALDLSDCEVVVGTDLPEGVRASPLSELLATAPTSAVEQAFAAVGPDTVAKVLFTSGSTGMPKGVINTHRMMCANMTMAEQTWTFVRSHPLVLVDWLPWNHTFGGNHNVNLTLAQAGTMYIDAGRPAPGLIEHTVRNLSEISPTIYFNVPAGYSALLPYLEKDERLAQKFFADLQLVFYAGAALSQDLWDRLEALSIRTTGLRVPMLSSWGSTETAPIATAGHRIVERAGIIGLPPPGVTLRLVPSAGKLEVRVRGPNVFPGYWGRPDLTQEAFDEDGFYRIGDAVRLADPGDLSKGLVFDGRVAEDFKLSTGTWVHAGGLRIAALAAAAPVLQDAVVTGHDRDCVGLLAWPNLAAMKEICADPAVHDDPARLIASAEVREHVRSGIARHNAAQSGSSMKIARVLIMTEPPSIDANEVTDKGYINQRATLERRQALVERVHTEPAPSDVLVIDDVAGERKRMSSSQSAAAQSDPQALKPFISRALDSALTQAEAEAAFDVIMSGRATASQIGGFLMILRLRGESIEEITGAATIMRAKCKKVRAPAGAMDIVGTGGDGKGTLNISTAAALIAASLGVPVAKHGNRAQSSKSGTADALALLGVNIDADVATIERCVARCGIGYMNAPNHHAAMRHVMPARTELGVRTIFNILGPLTNPAGVRRQLTGAFTQHLLRPMAETLRALGSEKAWLVHGMDGTDEISIAAPTYVAALEGGKVTELTVRPEDAGLPEHPFGHILGGTPEANAVKMRALLAGDRSPDLLAFRHAAILNAAAALLVAGRVATLAEGAPLAAAALDDGRARATLERLVEASNEK